MTERSSAKSLDSLGENPGRGQFCDSCGNALQPRTEATRRAAFDTCSSCGRVMDRAVYFTMCPHCGFNYRIEVLPVDEEVRLTLASLLPSFFVIAVVVCAAFMILLLT